MRPTKRYQLVYQGQVYSDWLAAGALTISSYFRTSALTAALLVQAAFPSFVDWEVVGVLEVEILITFPLLHLNSFLLSAFATLTLASSLHSILFLISTLVVENIARSFPATSYSLQVRNTRSPQFHSSLPCILMVDGEISCIMEQNLTMGCRYSSNLFATHLVT